MKASEFDEHPELGEDFWGSDPEYSVSLWAYEVEDGNTRLGYWDWVICQREQAKEVNHDQP